MCVCACARSVLLFAASSVISRVRRWLRQAVDFALHVRRKVAAIALLQFGQLPIVGRHLLATVFRLTATVKLVVLQKIPLSSQTSKKKKNILHKRRSWRSRNKSLHLFRCLATPPQQFVHAIQHLDLHRTVKFWFAFAFVYHTNDLSNQPVPLR